MARSTGWATLLALGAGLLAADSLFALPGAPGQHGGPATAAPEQGGAARVPPQPWASFARPSSRGAPAVAAGLAAVAALVAIRGAGRHRAAPCRGPSGAAAAPTQPAPRSRVAAKAAAMPVTGNTLAASLKMACDLTGADYAVYWVSSAEALVVAASYASPSHEVAMQAMGVPGTFAVASEFMCISNKGFDPVAKVAATGQSAFLPSVAAEEVMERKSLAAEYGIQSLCLMPFEAGVLEFGTTAAWSEMPVFPPLTTTLGKMREGFEDFGAKYMMLWAEKDGDYSVVADYKIPERVAALKSVRGDDTSFISLTKEMKLPAAGDSYVAQAARTKEEVISTRSGEDPKLERSDIAKEFSVSSIHFVPVEGAVLEYGTPEDNKLAGKTLAAALKMRCDTSGADYSIYWTEVAGEYVAAGDYIAPDLQKALEGKGKKESLTEACAGIKFSPSDSNPVATCNNTAKPVFLPSAAAESTLDRPQFTSDYDLKSVCFKKTEGGVMEFGISSLSGKAPWTEMPNCADLPKGHMKKAFNEMEAVYMMMWQQEGGEGTYHITGEYEIPERQKVTRSIRQDSQSFASMSQELVYATGGDAVIADAARSGKEIIIFDPSNPANDKFNRQELAKEFGVGEIHIVPCPGGVLEYGKALWW